MLILFQVLYHFAVDSLVLESPVQDNEDLGGDCPVIQVGNVAFQDELKRPNGTNLVLMFAIKTLKQV